MGRRVPGGIVIHISLFRQPLHQLSTIMSTKKRENSIFQYCFATLSIMSRIVAFLVRPSHHLLLWETLVSRPAVMDSACYVRRPLFACIRLKRNKNNTRASVFSGRQDYSGYPIDPTYFSMSLSAPTYEKKKRTEIKKNPSSIRPCCYMAGIDR